jgi:hypothetical protein
LYYVQSDPGFTTTVTRKLSFGVFVRFRAYTTSPWVLKPHVQEASATGIIKVHDKTWIHIIMK